MRLRSYIATILVIIAYNFCVTSYVYTVYGKTFEWENFHGFSADRESFPLESLAMYST